ncbi:MAG: anaerobic sulfatase maturase [Chloroflexi bacterium]|nr:anaerobic sulfatase maturase [Chloroflexota bacterium]
MNTSEAPLASVLVKPAGADCNLNCSYCFYKDKGALYPEIRRHRMPDEVLDSLIRQVMALSVQHASFSWQGGEPTLMGLQFFERVVSLQQRYGRGQTVTNGLQTNATLLNDEWGRFLRRYRFLVGVSLDGPGEMHDAHRVDRSGQGSFQRVMRGVSVLHQHNVAFNILVALTKQNICDPADLFHFFLAQDLRHLQFIPCVERDPVTHNLASFSISADEYGEFLCRTFDLWLKDGQPTAYIRFFDELLIAYVSGRHPSCIHRERCGDYVVVEHNGDVYACDFFVEPVWRLGNLLETPLIALLQGKRFNAFRRRKQELAAECRRCEYLHLCHGGCPKYRLLANGNIASPNHFCAAYRRFFAHSAPAMRALAWQVIQPDRRVGRNDPCPCGSGRKYKHCCGRVRLSPV